MKKLVLLALVLLLSLPLAGVLQAQDGDDSATTPIAADNITALAATFDLTDDNADFFFAAISANGTYAALDYNGSIVVYELASYDVVFEVRADFTATGGVQYGLPVFAGDNQFVYSTIRADAEGNITLEDATMIDLNNDAVIGRFPGLVIRYLPAFDALQAIDINNFDTLTTQDVITGQELGRVTIPTEGERFWYDFSEQFEYPVYSADGSLAAVPLLVQGTGVVVEFYAGDDFSLASPLQMLELGVGEVDTLALSPDGSLLALTLYDEETEAYSIRLYDTATLEMRALETGQNGRPSQATFSSGGDLLLVSEREVVNAYDVASGDLITDFRTLVPGNLEVMALSDDGTALLTAGYTTAEVYTVTE